MLVLVFFGDVFPVPALFCLQGRGGASFLQLALVTVTPAVNYQSTGYLGSCSPVSDRFISFVVNVDSVT